MQKHCGAATKKMKMIPISCPNCGHDFEKHTDSGQATIFCRDCKSGICQ